MNKYIDFASKVWEVQNHGRTTYYDTAFLLYHNIINVQQNIQEQRLGKEERLGGKKRKGKKQRKVQRQQRSEINSENVLFNNEITRSPGILMEEWEGGFRSVLWKVCRRTKNGPRSTMSGSRPPAHI